MTLIGVVIFLLVIGFLLWLVSIAPFIDATIKRIIYGVIIFVVILWLLRSFLGGAADVRLW